MNNSFIRTLSGVKGRLITIASGVIAGLVVRALAKFGFEPDLQTLNDITELAGIGVILGMEWAVIHLNAEGVKKIQQALPPEIKDDGVPGDKTVAAVEEMAAQVSENQNTPP